MSFPLIASTWLSTIASTVVLLLSLGWYLSRGGDGRAGRPEQELEVLYPDDDADPDKDYRVDIVAVHGLGSGASWSWSHPVTGKNWLRHFLPGDLDHQARIMAFDYWSNWDTYAQKKIFEEFAVDLLVALEDRRKSPEECKRPLIFIGHSFGGLLIKQALITAFEKGSRYSAISDCTTSVVFLGVPHEGSNLLLYQLGWYFALIKRPYGSSTELLDIVASSGYLDSLQRRFLSAYDSIYIASFYETVPERLFGIFDIGTVVSRKSATVIGPKANRFDLGLKADHRGINKFPHGDDQSYSQVLRELKRLVDRAPGALDKDWMPLKKAKCCWNVPLPKNDYYVADHQDGTRQELRDMASAGKFHIAIYGLGGVGKTQDILDFIYEYQGSKTSVFWVHAGSKETFEQDYRAIAALLELPGHEDPKQDIRPAVKFWFEHTELDYILVLDNADNPADSFPESLETTSSSTVTHQNALANYVPLFHSHRTKAMVLISTRSSEVAESLARGTTLNKRRMSVESALELFEQYHSGTREEKQQDSVVLLLEVIEYLPLAIVQVASYLKATRCPPSEYLRNFNTTLPVQERLLSKSYGGLQRGYTATVLTTFHITFQQINENWPLAGSLLELIACVNRQGVPRDLLAAVIPEGDLHEIEVREAIGTLLNFSLLIESPDELSYGMHSLVHLSLRLVMEKQAGGLYVDRAAGILDALLPWHGGFELWDVWKIYFPHFIAFIGIEPKESEELVRICNGVSHFLLSTGDLAKAEELALRAFQTSKILFDDYLLNMPDHAFRSGRQVQGEAFPQHMLDAKAILASAYSDQGRWDEAEKLELEVLRVRQRVLGNEHPDTLASMGNLASTYSDQGRWDEAEKLQLEVLRVRLLGNEHPGTLNAMNNLASTYSNQGRWDEADKLEVEVLRVRQRVLGNEHPHTLSSMNNLASIYRDQGRWDEAEKLEVEVLRVEQRVLGDEHPHTLSSMSNLASTYRDQGRYEEAEKLDIEVLRVRQRLLGNEHPHTLISMSNLAVSEYRLGSTASATAMMQQAVELRTKILGADHPDTQDSIDWLRSWSDTSMASSEKDEEAASIDGSET